MRLFYLLILLLSYPYCHAQVVKTDLQKNNLHGKVKKAKLLCGRWQGSNIDSFDIVGYLVKAVSGTHADSGQSDDGYITTRYFDKQHHLVKEEVYSTSNGYADSTFYQYDAKWHLTKSVADNPDLRTTTTNDYNAQGLLIKQTIGKQLKKYTQYSGSQILFFKYNSKNQLTEVNTTQEPQDTAERDGVFYNMGEYFVYGSEGFFVGKAIIKYNAAGQVIAQDIFDNKGRANGKASCKFDKNNNITSVVLQYPDRTPITLTIKYTYDSHNNWITMRDNNGDYTRVITYY